MDEVVEEVNQILEQGGFKVEPVQEKEAVKQNAESELSPEEKVAESSLTKTEDAPETKSEEDDDDDDGVPVGVKKRIGKLTKKFKEAEERLQAKEQRVAELEKKLSAFEEKHKPADEHKTDDFILSQEDQEEIVYQKLIEKTLAEDKNKPVEKRRFMSDEEVNDLLIDNPAAYERYVERNRAFRNETKKEISSKKTVEKVDNSGQEKQYQEFVNEHPELDWVPVLTELAKTVDIRDDEKLIPELKKKHEDIAEFFLFMKENGNKYGNLEKSAKVFKSQKFDNRFKKLESEKLKLENEIERLKSLDIGVKSSVSNVNKKTMTAEEKKLNDHANELLEMAGIR